MHALISKTARKYALNNERQKLTTPPKTVTPLRYTEFKLSGVASPKSVSCDAMMLVLVLMRTADEDEESSRRDRRYCIVEIR